MNICYSCFRGSLDSHGICSNCGADGNAGSTDPRHLAPGTVLNERYMIGKAIGSGGFGVTYVAWDATLQQKVAIKEYLPGEFSTRVGGQRTVSVYGGEKAEQYEAGKSKFYDESRQLAAFRAVNGIVQVFNSFQENRTAYIVMEYLEGETLSSRLKREGKLSEKDTLSIMLPILRALDIIHRENILHRDIAPDNIFLTNTGGAKLLDFGAARSVTGTHSKSLTVLYKDGYTPEEQYRSHGQQGTWSDVYSCAATMYKMLTGFTPPGALERRRKDELKAPSKAGAAVSRSFEIAIMNALNVDVSRRTQSAGQFLQELSDTKVKDRFKREKEKKIGKLSWQLKLAAGLCCGLIVTFLGLLYGGVIGFDIPIVENFLLPAGKVRTPNIINKTVSSAHAIIDKRGLELNAPLESYMTEEDIIASQSLRAGSIVDRGSVVDAKVVLSYDRANIISDLEWTKTPPNTTYYVFEQLDPSDYQITATYLDGRREVIDSPEITPLVFDRAGKNTISVSYKGKDLELKVNVEERPTTTVEESDQSSSESPDSSPTVVDSGKADISEIKSLLSNLNKYRREAGVPELTWDSSLASQAVQSAAAWSTGSSFPGVSGVWIARQCNGARTASKAISDWIQGNDYVPSEANILLSSSYTRAGGSYCFLPDGNQYGYKYFWCIILN